MSSTRLPLVIDDDLYLRLLEQKNLKTKARILGARHGDFILIEEPVVSIGDRLSAFLQGRLICWLFQDGDIYRFNSKFLKVENKLAFLAYPTEVEIEQVRQFHRIQVNIEVNIHIEEARETAKAVMQDISEGGCYMAISSLILISQNMTAVVDFLLPDNQIVKGLRAKIRTVKFFKMKKTTEVGLQFIGPPEELAKIASFCQYCLFFKV